MSGSGPRKRTTTSRPPRAGFTLLETVAALAIFAMTVAVLSPAYVSSVSARHQVRADRSEMTVLRFVRDTVAVISDRSVVEAGGNLVLPEGTTVRWEGGITPLDYTGLYAVDVSVTFADQDKNPRVVRLELFRPAWATVEERSTWSAAAAARWKERKK